MKPNRDLRAYSMSAIAVVALLVLGAALLRLVPHPPNFAPIVAMALLCGAVVGDRRWALALPFAAMIISDAVLGFHAQLWVVYASLLACIGIGMLMKGRIRVASVAVATVSASLTFFVLTNLGVWAASGMYPLTGAGLVACFTAALPFLQNGLAGDLFFSAVLFAGYALVIRFGALHRPEPA